MLRNWGTRNGCQYELFEMKEDHGLPTILAQGYISELDSNRFRHTADKVFQRLYEETGINYKFGCSLPIIPFLAAYYPLLKKDAEDPRERLYPRDSRGEELTMESGVSIETIAERDAEVPVEKLYRRDSTGCIREIAAYDWEQLRSGFRDGSPTSWHAKFVELDRGIAGILSGFGRW